MSIAIPTSRAPQRLLPDAGELVRRAELLGLRPTSIRVEPPTTGERLPRTVGDLVQHILDEALDNAGRHAPGAEVMINVVDEPAAIRIEVINGPAVGDVTAGPGPGHGVPALAGRIAAMGGMLCVGPASGGFALRARLPVEASAAAAVLSDQQGGASPDR